MNIPAVDRVVQTTDNMTAAQAFQAAIEDLFSEAKNHLDGKPIESQAQADDLTVILDGMKELLRDSEKTRLDENKPYREAEKANNSKWKAVQEPAKLTITEATKPLTVWRVAEQAKKDAEAQRLREKAHAEELAAQEARKNATSLEDAEQAEALLKQADIAKKTANKIDRAATGLRTSYKAEITDPIAFGKWAWHNRRVDYMKFLETLASQNIEAAKAGTLPGVEVQEVKKAA